MEHNIIATGVDEGLRRAARRVLDSGDEITSRAGLVKELLHVGITLREPCDRYITTPARKASVAAQIAETVWVLSGRNDVEWLTNYLPRAAEFSDDGWTWSGGYGPRLRAWPRRDGDGGVIDQLRWVVDHLRADRSSRRAVVTIYDPVMDSQPGKDIPCNNWLDFKSRLGRLHLHVAIRSNDLIWGWSGINAFEWSVLQEVVASILGIDVGPLSFSISSLHVYDRHWSRAEKITDDIPVLGTPSPRTTLKSVEELDDLLTRFFKLEERIRLGQPVSSLDDFPDPLLRSWLRVLRWWWTGDESHLEPLAGTTLYNAARVGIQPKRVEKAPAEETGPGAIVGINNASFSEYVADLHAKKHAGYGDSWKKRGELLSILPNIARKVDRLQQPGDDVETKADTAIDLLVYLLKYRWWLYDQSRMGGPFASTPEQRADEVTRVSMFLKHLDRYNGWVVGVPYEMRLAQRFDEMASRIEFIGGNPHYAEAMDRLISDANALARREFWKAGNDKRSWKGYEDE